MVIDIVLVTLGGHGTEIVVDKVANGLAKLKNYFRYSSS